MIRKSAQWGSAISLCLLLGFASPSSAQQIVTAGCLEDVSPGGVVCTANDVTFTLVGLGVQTDGCVESGLGFCSNDTVVSCANDADCAAPGICEYSDTLEILLRAVVRNTTAQARYDIGLWFGTDGDPSLCSSNVCTGDLTTACDENVDCAVAGGTCEGHQRCVVDADCSAVGLGTCEPADGARRGTCGRAMLEPSQVAYCSGDNPASPTGPTCGLNGDCPGAETCQVIGHCSATTSTGCFFDGDCLGGEVCEVPGCDPLDLLGGAGPFLSSEPATDQGQGSPIDLCGDLFDENTVGCDDDGDGNWDDSILDFTEAQTFPCADVDGDGFVNIPTCATWGNEDSEVHLGTCVGGNDVGNFCTADNQCGGGGTCTDNFVAGGGFPQCDSPWEVINGTPAKCNCENINSNVPAPDLDLTCSCNTGNTGTVPPGAQVLCTVEFTNNASCTAVSQCSGDGSFCTTNADCTGGQTCEVVPEEFQCGTARYVRFETDDTLSDTSDAGGSFAVNGTVSASATGNGDLQITPISVAGTDFVVGASHVGSVEFWYTVDDTLTTAETIDLTTETWWTNDGQCSVTTTTACTASDECPMGETCVPTFATEDLQSLQAVCPINVVPFWVSVSDFSATRVGRDVLVEWRTDSEVGTVSFDLYRQDAKSGRNLQVNPAPVTALQRTGGAVYRVLDERALGGGRSTYTIVETNLQGARRSVGPFEVTVGPPDDAFLLESLESARALEPSERQVHRAAAARREAAAFRASQTDDSTRSFRDPPLAASTKEEAVYRVTAAELSVLWNQPEDRVRRDIRQGRIRLSNRGAEVAWHGSPEYDEIYFFGQDVASQFTRYNVYQVEAKPGEPGATTPGGQPIAVGPGSAFSDRAHHEQDILPALVVALDPESDYWFWDGIIAQSTKTMRSFTLDVPDPANSGTAELSVELWGATDDPLVDSEHQVIVRLNGQDLGSATWDGIGSVTFDFALDPLLLVAGDNVVELEAVLGPGVENSLFFIDSFDVRYLRLYRAVDGRLAFRGDGNDVVTVEGFDSAEILVFDVTDPAFPKQVSDTTIDAVGAEYRVSLEPSDPDAELVAVARDALAVPFALEVQRPTIDLQHFPGADYVVVAPSHLVATAGQLADYRASTGLSAVVVDLEEIYAQFNNGLASPHAIEAFMDFAYENWVRTPRYLVLVGATSFDYKDNLGHGGNLVPTLMTSTPWGLFSTDLAYGDVAGDSVPEVSVGRIPVLTASELAEYVVKVAAYEASAGDAWRGRALMLADDPDEAGDFPSESEGVESMLTPALTPTRVYLSDLPIAQARALMFEQLEAGVGYVNYVGHGGLTRMAQEGLFTIADVAGLQNQGLEPVVGSATCIIGRYAVPGFESLAEALVLEPDGGAVAVWSPSGLSYDVDAYLLNRSFADAAFAAPGATLGEAMLEALEQYDGFFEHMPKIYNVVGDPALGMR